MLPECNCVLRECIHFLGIRNDSKKFNEAADYYACKAFPKGIPDDIAYSNNLHLEPIPHDRGFRYERKEEKLKVITDDEL